MVVKRFLPREKKKEGKKGQYDTKQSLYANTESQELALGLGDPTILRGKELIHGGEGIRGALLVGVVTAFFHDLQP